MRRKSSPVDDADDRKETNQLGVVLELLPWLWPKNRPGLRARVIISVTALATGKLIIVQIPILYQHMIDTFDQQPATLPVVAFVLYGAALLFSRLFQESRDLIFAHVGQHAIRVIARDVFRHIHRLPMSFHLDRRTGALARVIERGVMGIEFFLAFLLFNVGPTILELVLASIWLWVMFAPIYAVVTLVTVIVYVIWTLVITSLRMAIRRKLNKYDAEKSGKSVDSLLNYETVKYFGNESFESHRYDLSLAEYERTAVINLQSASLLNMGQHAIVVVGQLALLAIAGRALIAGELTIGGLVAVNVYLINLYRPLGVLGFAYRQIRTSLTDMEALFALRRQENTVSEAPDAIALPQPVRGHIAFSGVSFGYRPDRVILEELSFELPPGRKIAFVGTTGSGKTTITRLLYRFWDVSGGVITIDGHDIRRLTHESLRAAVGIVPQDCVLFNDSIGFNIGYGKPGASQQEIEQAARIAQLDGFIDSLPERYDTMVGERGLKLSGGEKQRVGIARCLLKGAPILVLDEASAALDSATEQAMQEALAAAMHGRSVVMIAHRLSTVSDVDEICLLEAGRIVERGSHESLLALGGMYARLWQKQSQVRGDADELLT